MKYSRKLLVGSIIAFILFAGLFSVTVTAQDEQSERSKNYKNILEKLNSSFRSIRLRNDPSGSLNNAKSQYDSLVAEENFETQPELKDLDNQIDGMFNQSKTTGDLRSLRDKVSEMSSELGVGIPFAFKYASLVILSLSFVLAFFANLLCRRLTDWEGFWSARERIEELRRKIDKAREGKGGKKGKKIELREEDIEKNQRKIWAASIKQAGFYLAPFFILLAWLLYIYADWTVVWLPFNWFTSGMFDSIGVSLSSFGWFIFTYFGFAQVWRGVLVPEE